MAFPLPFLFLTLLSTAAHQDHTRWLKTRNTHTHHGSLWGGRQWASVSDRQQHTAACRPSTVSSLRVPLSGHGVPFGFCVETGPLPAGRPVLPRVPRRCRPLAPHPFHSGWLSIPAAPTRPAGFRPGVRGGVAARPRARCAALRATRARSRVPPRRRMEAPPVPAQLSWCLRTRAAVLAGAGASPPSRLPPPPWAAG